jgi:hypothetical protein
MLIGQSRRPVSRPTLVDLEEWRMRYTQARRVGSFQPALEGLENRWCPSVAAAVTGGHILTLTGDGAANDVRINDDGSDSLTVRINGGPTQTYEGIDTLNINTGNGNDGIYYTVRGDLVQNRAVNVNLGDGNSRFDFRTTPGSGVIGQGIDPLRLDVNVHGGKGNDWVSGNFGDVFNAKVTVRAYFGTGNNNFNYYLTGDISDGNQASNGQTNSPGTPATQHTSVSLLAIGGTGTNSLAVNAQNVSVGSGTLLETDLRANDRNDLLSTKYSGWVDGKLSEREYGGTGNSRMYDQRDVWSNCGGVVDTVVRGATGNDSITLDAQNGASNTLVSYHTVADGGRGHSLIQSTSDVFVKNAFVQQWMA